MNNKTVLIFFAFCFAVSNGSPSPSKGKAPLLKLNNGRDIPQLALGTFLGWDIEKDEPVKPKGDEVVKAVEWAIDAGYRHIDTAAVYGDEDQVGQAVNNKIKDGTVKREDVFVTTKVWDQRHQREEVVASIRDSLKLLKLDYVDLYLVHSPMASTPDGKPSDIDYLETWKGMEDAYKLGLAKSIGLSNFNTTQIQRVIDNSEIKPAVLEVEVNPNLRNKKLIDYAHKNGIVVMSYSPFGSLIPSRSSKDSPAPRLNDPVLTEIAKKYGKTTPQIVLRYLVDRQTIPIPKSLNKSRIEQNIDIFDFKLTEEEIAKIDAFDRHYRIVDPVFWKKHPHYPFVKPE